MLLNVREGIASAFEVRRATPKEDITSSVTEILALDNISWSAQLLYKSTVSLTTFSNFR